MSKSISKLRSKIYDTIIELRVPIRFYWDENGFDGIEFGPLDKCSRYQFGLLKVILEQISYTNECSKVIDYMREHKMDELRCTIRELDAHKLGIPKAFIDAFDE